MELNEIQSFLNDELSKHAPLLRAKGAIPKPVEYAGTIPVMQGKQKVDGHYFASIVPKPKDIRLYFFPIYTHVQEYSELSDGLRKQLKGKSCFHIKNLDASLKNEVSEMIAKGVSLYKTDGLI